MCDFPPDLESSQAQAEQRPPTLIQHPCDNEWIKSTHARTRRSNSRTSRVLSQAVASFDEVKPAIRRGVETAKVIMP